MKQRRYKVRWEYGTIGIDGKKEYFVKQDSAYDFRKKDAETFAKGLSSDKKNRKIKIYQL